MFRVIASVAVALAMIACTTTAPTQKAVALMGGDIIARAPAGYCFDGTASNPRKGFAVIAPCAALGVSEAAPNTRAIATIQVGDKGSGTVTGSETQMRDFLQSDAGAVLLSSVGNSDTVTGVTAQAGAGIVTVKFRDSAPHGMAGLQNSEWRAFTDVDGRLVTIALRGQANSPLTNNTGNWLLNAIAAGIKPAGSVATTQSSDS